MRMRLQRLLFRLIDVFLSLPTEADIDISHSMPFFGKEGQSRFYKVQTERQLIADSCGPLSLQMMMGYLGHETSDTISLLNELKALGAFSDHYGIVLTKAGSILKKRNITYKTYYYCSTTRLLWHVLKGRPAIVSIQSKGSGHIVVVVGCKIEPGGLVTIRILDPGDKHKVVRNFALRDWEKKFNHRALIAG